MSYEGRGQVKPANEYSSHDCGGPEVCSGCLSYRHGVYKDGSGDQAALRIQRRLMQRWEDEADVFNELTRKGD
jgi:hypothetical protein